MACATSPALYGQNLPPPWGRPPNLPHPLAGEGRVGLLHEVSESVEVRREVGVELHQVASRALALPVSAGGAAWVVVSGCGSAREATVVEVHGCPDQFSGHGVARGADSGYLHVSAL